MDESVKRLHKEMYDAKNEVIKQLLMQIIGQNPSKQDFEDISLKPIDGDPNSEEVYYKTDLLGTIKANFYDVKFTPNLQ